MLMSWTAVSWSVTSYYRALRVSIAHPQSNNTERSLCSAIGYFCWRAFEIGPRIIAIALFASQFTYFVFAFFIIHWTCMISWLKCQKVKVYEKFGENLFFIVAVGFTQIFAFMNVCEGHTRYRAMLYYLVFYCENFTFLALWILVPLNDIPDWMVYVFGAVIPVGFVLHLICQLMYYSFCHPKRDDINCCIWNKFTFFYQNCVLFKKVIS